jgi:hypothetical protein
MVSGSMRRALILAQPVIALAAALLAGCATIPRYEAAGDIHAFLVSIRDGDRTTFDQHVDKPALKEQLRSRLMAEAGRSSGSLGSLGALVAGPLVDLGVDTLVRPDVFRAVAVEHGYAPDRPIPGVIAIGQFVRPLDGGRACVIAKRDGPCVLMFRNEGGAWKLIGFEGKIEFGKGGKLKLSE